MAKDIIIACDFKSADETIKFLDKLTRIRDEVVSCDDISIGAGRPYVKIGMEAFYACGPEFVKKLKDAGYEDVRLIDTTDGRFMGHKEAAFLGLGGSTLLVGRK